MSRQAPKRRWTVDIQVGGDQWVDVVNVLRELLPSLERGPHSSVSGGYSNGHYVQLREDPEMTPEKYQAELKRYAEFFQYRHADNYTLLCGPEQCSTPDGKHLWVVDAPCFPEQDSEHPAAMANAEMWVPCSACSAWRASLRVESKAKPGGA